MGLPNKDEVEGKLDQAKGVAKKGAGRVLNDPELENEGEADRAGGHVQEKFGTARRKIGEAVEDLGEKLGH
ncbi:MAG TPA: CsbD family protein [Pyrinomonadaceae bacterium]